MYVVGLEGVVDKSGINHRTCLESLAVERINLSFNVKKIPVMKGSRGLRPGISLQEQVTTYFTFRSMLIPNTYVPDLEIPVTEYLHAQQHVWELIFE